MPLMIAASRLPWEGARYHLDLREEELLLFWGDRPLPLNTRVHSVEATLYLRKDRNRNLLLSGKLCLTFSTNCRRCLKDVECTLESELQRRFLPSTSFPIVRERENWDETFLKEWQEEEEYDGNTLDLEAWIASEVLLALPEHFLCTPECKGVCVVCGGNRNEKECGCSSNPLMKQRGVSSLPPNL